MTTMPATIIAAPRTADATLVITFAFDDPLGLIDVETEMADRLSHEGYLALIRETANRLHLYAHDYEAAVEAEMQLTLAQ